MKKLSVAALTVILISVFGFSGCEKKEGPQAAFSANPTSGSPPLEVTFTDASTGNPLSWEWDFGDGGTSIEQNPVYTYDTAGTYDVMLIVSDDAGTDTTTEPDYIVVDEGGAYNEEQVDVFTFKWRITDENLDVILRAPTTGWVAVGFNPSSAMQDANFIIGYVDGENVMIDDQFGDGAFSHKPDVDLDGTDDISNASGSEVDGTTQIIFSIPLDSGDENDRALTAGETYKILFGHGADGTDDFTTKHTSSRTSADITL